MHKAEEAEAMLRKAAVAEAMRKVQEAEAMLRKAEVAEPTCKAEVAEAMRKVQDAEAMLRNAEEAEAMRAIGREWIDRDLRDLPKGVLQWNPPPPSNMFVGATISVGATIYPKDAPRGASQTVTPPTPTTAPLVISPLMSARLYGSGFEIYPNNERHQGVTRETPTTWTWQVTAREPGVRELTVEVKIFLAPDWERYETARFTVRVTAAKPGLLQRLKWVWDGANAFYAAPLSAIAAGAIVAWLRRRRHAAKTAGSDRVVTRSDS